MKQNTYILLGLGLLGAYVFLNRKKQTAPGGTNVLANTPFANLPQTTGNLFVVEDYMLPNFTNVEPPVNTPGYQQWLVDAINTSYANNPPTPLNLNLPVF